MTPQITPVFAPLFEFGRPPVSPPCHSGWTTRDGCVGLVVTSPGSVSWGRCETSDRKRGGLKQQKRTPHGSGARSYNVSVTWPKPRRWEGALPPEAVGRSCPRCPPPVAAHFPRFVAASSQSLPPRPRGLLYVVGSPGPPSRKDMVVFRATWMLRGRLPASVPNAVTSVKVQGHTTGSGREGWRLWVVTQPRGPPSGHLRCRTTHLVSDSSLATVPRAASLPSTSWTRKAKGT